MSLFDDASLVVTPNGVKAGKLYSIKPTDGSGDLNVVRATTAMRVNSDGLIESVAANVPRLDYTNGSCPSILVEPQRTNLALRSEEFDNASWTKPNVTVTPNAIIAPDGNLTADLITATATNGYLYPANTSIFSSAGGTSRAYSVFLKAGTATSVRLIIATASVSQNFSSTFNLSLGTATADTANTNVFIENYGNDWYRCTISATIASATYSELQLGRVANGLNFYAWGAQLEVGSNATSYIPTVASAVTRNADVISKTGISDLIGQTEGTIFVDAKSFINSVDFSSLRRCYLILTDGTFSNRIEISKFGSNNILLNNDIKVRISSSGSTIFDQTVATNYSGNLKLALAYKSGSTIVYINGVNVYEYNTAYTVPATSFLNLGNGYNQPTTDSLNYISIWKTALTDQECINLTTL